MAKGVLPDWQIEALIEQGSVDLGPRGADVNQIQPASLDLRLGMRGYRVRASFLPGHAQKVSERLGDLTLHEFDLGDGTVLETNGVYIVPLMESVKLPQNLSASANPKSSTGRLDVFTRLITDHGASFDEVAPGYQGPLYAEITPRSLPIIVRPGSRLLQLRFRDGQALIDDGELKAIHKENPLTSRSDAVFAGGLALSIDLEPSDDRRVVGYRAKRHAGVIDVDKPGAYRAADFWETLPSGSGELVLDPNEFYILVSKEAVQVPENLAAEMKPFDHLVGEFRVHYAGFFDPGFGISGAGGAGSRAVLEVRSRDVPFILTDGQIIGKLVYEHLAGEPKTLYGSDLKSHYQAQGLKLSKHFVE